MYPYSNPYAAQLISGLYASAPGYNDSLYQVPSDAQPFWNPLQTPVQPEGFIYNPLDQQMAAQPDKKEEEPTLTIPKAAPAKAKPAQEEEEVVFQSGDESHERSPRLRYNQKFGRNITANVFGNLLREVHTHPHYRQVVEKAVARHQTLMTSDEFIDTLRQKCSRLKNYVGAEKMTRMLRAIVIKKRMHTTVLSREQDFSLLLRVVGRYYLHHNHVPFAWTTLKLKDRSRAMHMAGIRKVAEVMQPNPPCPKSKP